MPLLRRPAGFLRRPAAGPPAPPALPQSSDVPPASDVDVWVQQLDLGAELQEDESDFNSPSGKVCDVLKAGFGR